MIVLILSGIPTAECNQNKTPGEIHSLDVGGIDPPTIEWMFDENATTGTGMVWDGIYTGQTEISWSWSSWINDSDTVDTVFFQYRHSTDEDWMNRTPSLIAGDSINGEYSYSFVQEIWWDWETNRPEVEGGLYVGFRIFANDSLGNWRTTLATFKSGGWMDIVPPNYISPLFGLGIAAVSISILVIVVVIYRRKHVATV